MTALERELMGLIYDQTGDAAIALREARVMAPALAMTRTEHMRREIYDAHLERCRGPYASAARRRLERAEMRGRARLAEEATSG